MPTRTTSLDAGSTTASDRRWWWAGLLLCLLMLAVHVLAGMNSGGMADFWRDMYWATSIAHGERFPLAGPQIYQPGRVGRSRAAASPTATQGLILSLIHI